MTVSNILKKQAKAIILIISIALFIISLTQQCYCTTIICNDSLFVFLFGISGFYFSWAGMTWLSNPLIIISWFTFGRSPKLSLVTSCCAFILSFSFLIFTHVLDNEGGNIVTITNYKVGYWLWTGSSLSMSIGNCIVFLNRRRLSPPVR